MNLLFSLALKSLKYRKFSVLLTTFSIALSVALFLSIEQIRVSARESFANTISKTDLIVGGRGGSLQLLLYTVFRMGSATNNVSYKNYQKWSDNPAVAWTIPYSLGDSHRNFRVVATNDQFYAHYYFHGDRTVEFSSGHKPAGIFDVVLGYEVAKNLSYVQGQKVVISHGYSEGGSILEHDNMPFTVVGILHKTSTPIDSSLYISLEAMEAIHIDWQDGSAPIRGKETHPDQIKKEDIEIGTITSFLVGTKNRIDTLRLQREINQFRDEPLLAIIPGVALSELWTLMSYAEDALKIIALSVVIVGLIGMMLAIYNSLNERRREMAILRASGAGQWTIYFLLLIESTGIACAGALSGLLLVYGFILAAKIPIENAFGITLTIQSLSPFQLLYLCGVVLAGFILGLIPAWRAYKNALSDGLSPKV